ncbi:MAG: DUF2334 domain-containing protein [Balneola sp.]
MKQRLCTGLISPSDYLLSLLDSIGIWYEEIDFKKELSKNYSVIILEKVSPNSSQQTKINDFLRNNGSLLEISTKPYFYSDELNTSYSKTIFNTNSESGFNRVGPIDIYSHWTSAKNSTLFSGLIGFQKTENSSYQNVCFLGLDVHSLPKATSYTRKRFYSPSGLFPDEIVNKVSRDSLSDLIELCIKKLLYARNLPFIKKWTSPKPEPVFGFRVDSDFGSKKSLDSIYNLLSDFGIKATWFLHVQAHENYLEHLKTFGEQELALHGYNHGYSGSIAKIQENIRTGLSVLASSGIHPSGFCAPYGIWNFGLQKVLSEFNFNYTSEFTSGYDSVPFVVPKSSHLQIPIHPICTGSMNRKGYSSDQMKEYFLSVYERKKSSYKPIFFYHHPMQKGLDVFGEIFKKVRADGLTNLTFNEYASFWKKRQDQQISIYSEGKKVFIESNDPDLYLYISNTNDEFDLVFSKTQVLEKSAYSTFKYDTPSLPSNSEIEQIHQNRFQLYKTNILDWRNRQRL